MSTKFSRRVSTIASLCLVGVVGAGAQPAYEHVEPVVTNATATAPSLAARFIQGDARLDPPEYEPLDRDEFLGQVEAAISTQSFSERIDPFSGTLHLNMVYVVLPGNAGLDIVVQSYYSSNVLNRVDNPGLTRHVASADMSGRLGDSGWQLHMGKLMNPTPTSPDAHTTLIMPDGSTHTLYDRNGHPGKISQEGWIYNVSDSVHTVRLTNGLVYTFDSVQVGAEYNYLARDSDGDPIPVIQCTRIEDLNGNAIVVAYRECPIAPGFASLIDSVSFDDSTDTRSVGFTYYFNPPPSGEENWLLKNINVMDDTNVVQTWTFHYGDPQDDLLQPQFGSTSRSVASLTHVVPPEGGPWNFIYNPLGADYEDGRWLMHRIQSPRNSRIIYAWGAEVFDVGANYCDNVPQFLAVQNRQTVRYDWAHGTWHNVAATTYTYTNGGQEDATTDIVTKDSQTLVKLATQQHVFHGWGTYVPNDLNLWRVGLAKSATITTMDDLGDPLETVTTSSVWEQGDPIPISLDTRTTSPWATCSNFRWLSPVRYVRPTSVTRVVERHDSIPDDPPPQPPDPDSYETVSSSFDDWGNVGLILETSDDGLSRSTYLSYWQDATNNIMVGRVQGRDAEPGGMQCFHYDSLGRLEHSFTNPQDDDPAEDDVAVCTPTDPPEPIPGARSVGYTYYSDGNLETQTENNTPSSRVTTYSNYQYGSPKDTVVTTGTAEDIHFCREYGPLGTVTRETDGRGCDEGEEYWTAYDYDTLGRLTSADPPLADPVTYAYNGDWSVVWVTRGTQLLLYYFDTFGNLKEIFNEQTDHWTSLTNDALGRRREVTIYWDSEGDLPGDTYTYDPLGRLTAVLHPGEPATEITVSYAGSKVTVVDENAHITDFLYEAFGNPNDRRLAALVDSATKTTTYGYDPIFGQLERVAAPIPQGNRTFEYISGSEDCDNGFLLEEIHPESGTTSYEYNCLGSVTTRTRPGSETTNYDYDAAGRLTDIRYPDGAGTVHMDHDGASRRTSLINVSATFGYTYDDAGRLETVTQSITGGPSSVSSAVTTYGYDTLDRLKTITYPSTRVVTYGWDDSNWLENVTGEDGSGVEYLREITYHPSGMPDVVTFDNDVVTDYGIDDRYRLSGIVTTGPGGPLLNVGLGYDLASNVTTWTDHLPTGKNRTFGYDALDRLESATGMWGSLGFTYDELGNRETRTLDGETTEYDYSLSTNRLDTLSDALSGAELGIFTYDDSGRLRIEERFLPEIIFSDDFESGDTSAWGGKGGESTRAVLVITGYTFNAADEITQVSRSGITLGLYTYDGDGLRVSKSLDQQEVYYLRNQAGNTLAEYDQNGDLLAEYIYANGRQIGKVEPDGATGENRSFFHADHLGSALVITDDQGAVAWTGDYYPFGQEFSSDGDPDRYRFTQHELDTQTSLVYMHARYYSPGLGRFLSIDPVGGTVGSSQSWNRYAYVLNNPTKFVDPFGLEVYYADANLEALVSRLAARSEILRSTLARYQGEGSPDLHLRRGETSTDRDGSEAVQDFRGEYDFSYEGNWDKLESEEDLFPATGKYLTSARLLRGTITVGQSNTPFTVDEARHLIHEFGHAEDAARDPLTHLKQSADDVVAPGGRPLPHDDRPAEQSANQYQDRVLRQMPDLRKLGLR